jgi:hypothetical protein
MLKKTQRGFPVEKGGKNGVETEKTVEKGIVFNTFNITFNI